MSPVEAPAPPSGPLSLEPPAAEPAHLPDLAGLGLGRFAAGLAALVLAMLAASALLWPRSGSPNDWVAAAYGGAALACAAGGVGLGNARMRVPGAVFLAPVASAVALAVAVRQAARVGAPTPEALILAGILILATGVAVGVRVGAALALSLAVLLAGQALTGAASDAAGHTPLAAGLVAVQVLLAGSLSLLMVAGLRRSSARAAQAAQALDDRIALDRAASAAAAADAEAARTLHDTALNTLEAIAKGGAALDPALVRARCRSDLSALRAWHEGAASRDLRTELSSLAAHGAAVGVDLDFRVAESADRAKLPAQVSAAFTGAARELVTNVAKHSGTDHAEVQVWHDAEGLWVTVVDRGVGLREPAPSDHFGLADSVTARMAGVGGSATISPGPDGHGTAVELAWQPGPEDPFDLEPVELNVLAAAVLTAAGLFAAAVATLVTLLGWASFQRPWVALGAALVSAAALFAAGRSLRLGYLPGPEAVLAVVATYWALTWSAPVADPVCASITGERAGLDARLFLVALVVLFLPRFSQAALVIAAVVAGHALAGAMWSATFELCGSGTRNTGVVAGGILLAVWWFGRLGAGMSREFGRARAGALALRVRTNSTEQARLERQRWAQDALAGAEQILAGLVSGSQQLGDPGLARACTEESGFLRGMLLVGRAPREQARGLRRWLGRLRRAGLQVIVRGTFEGFAPPPDMTAEMDRVLAALTALHGPGRVSILAWGGIGGAGLSLEAKHARAETLAPLVDLGLVDVSAGTLTVVWDWEGVPDDVEQIPRGDRR